MGSKGYTGVNIQLVELPGSIAALCQSGREYYLEDMPLSETKMKQLVDLMEEQDTFIYWHNSFLLGD